MQGYDDPRLGALFTSDSYGYFMPLPPTNNNALSSAAKTGASKPKVDAASPLFWLRASEVSFLKAEAALYKLTGGNPKDLYEEGVTKSFEENGANGVAAYLQTDDLPYDINRSVLPYNREYSCKLSTGNVSPKWNDADSDEVKLQKIITQKYLALYPNAVEAWTEYRRTGYPYLLKPAYDKAYVSIGGEEDAITPERFRFAPAEYGTNPNMSEVPALLGGEDQGATKLWWVRNNRPKQPK